jgi:uncharacterized protein with PQ loop repeat
MTAAAIAQVFAYLGMVLSAGISLPQLARLRRTVNYAGVSWLTWTLAASSFALWCSYGVLLPIPAQIPGNVVSTIGSILVLLVLIRRGISPVRPLAVLASVVLVSFVSFSFDGARGIGWLALGVGACMRLPQLRLTVFASSLTDLSRTSWMLNSAACMSWLGYAILDHDGPVAASSILALVLASGIVLAAGRGRRDRRGDMDRHIDPHERAVATACARTTSCPRTICSRSRSRKPHYRALISRTCLALTSLRRCSRRRS